jgi:hypothetical protein
MHHIEAMELITSGGSSLTMWIERLVVVCICEKTVMLTEVSIEHTPNLGFGYSIQCCSSNIIEGIFISRDVRNSPNLSTDSSEYRSTQQ